MFSSALRMTCAPYGHTLPAFSARVFELARYQDGYFIVLKRQPRLLSEMAEDVLSREGHWFFY